MGFGAGQRAQNGLAWASHGPKRSICTPFVTQSALHPAGMDARGLGTSVEYFGRFWLMADPRGPLWAILSSGVATNRNLWVFLGPNIVDLMVLRRATPNPTIGALCGFTLSLGLPACLVAGVACLREMGVHPRPTQGVTQTAKAARCPLPPLLPPHPLHHRLLQGDFVHCRGSEQEARSLQESVV